MARKVKKSKAKRAAKRVVKKAKRVPAKKAETKKTVAKAADAPPDNKPFNLGYTF